MERKTGSVLAGTHSSRENGGREWRPNVIDLEVNGAGYPPCFAARHEFSRDEASAIGDYIVKDSWACERYYDPPKNDYPSSVVVLPSASHPRRSVQEGRERGVSFQAG
jgi:hypothetical protein